MIKRQNLIALILLGLPLVSYAQAPVVDDSENFAMLEQQEAAQDEQPLAQESSEDIAQADQVASEEQQEPLAKDDANANTIADNTDLVDKIQSMRQEIQELRGQVEVLTHDLKALQQQQLTFYKDLDARLRTANPAAGAQMAVQKEDQIAPMPVITHTTRLNPADEQISYLAAYELVKNKRYDEALNAMKAFVQQYPNGGYTANAQYWLGELYMVKKDYPQAISHFETVLKQFPKSSKAAACTLKIGYALAASGKESEARQRLQDVIRHYPDTPTAQLAKTKLRLLNAR